MLRLVSERNHVGRHQPGRASLAGVCVVRTVPTGRALSAVVHPGQPGLVVASHEIPAKKKPSGRGSGFEAMNASPIPTVMNDSRIKYTRGSPPSATQPNRQADRKQHNP